MSNSMSSNIKDKVQEFKVLLGKASYFNAAEASHGSEAKARSANRVLLRLLATELHGEGIDLDYIVRGGGYLVSKTDYSPVSGLDSSSVSTKELEDDMD